MCVCVCVFVCLFVCLFFGVFFVLFCFVLFCFFGRAGGSLRGGSTLFTNSQWWSESHFRCRGGYSLFCVSQAIFRATGRSSSCSFEGPAKPQPPHQRRKHRPHNSESEQYEGRSNAESTNLRTIGVEGRTAPPVESRVNTKIRRPIRAAKLETGTYHLLQVNAWSQAG